jgi:hypothetical protein
MRDGRTPPVAVDPSSVPRRWQVKFLQRIARFQAGKAYTITLSMPKQRDAEPTWTVRDEGYIENQR